jgi:hypothetical protein
VIRIVFENTSTEKYRICRTQTRKDPRKESIIKEQALHANRNIKEKGSRRGRITLGRVLDRKGFQ